MKLILLITIVLLVFVLSSNFISTSLVSAASARGTFTITNDSANTPQLSPDENATNSTETTTQQPTQSSFLTMIKNFFQAFFDWRKNFFGDLLNNIFSFGFINPAFFLNFLGELIKGRFAQDNQTSKIS